MGGAGRRAARDRSFLLSLSDVWSDDPAAAELIRAHADSATKRAAYLSRRWPGFDWEPICHEALYLAAYTWRPGPAGFHHWLRRHIYQRAGNQLATIRRRLGKLTPVEYEGWGEEAWDETSPAVEDELELSEDVERLRAAIPGTLTDREREVVTRRVYSGHTLQEIGDDFGFTRQYIRQIEARSIRKLRRELEPGLSA